MAARVLHGDGTAIWSLPVSGNRVRTLEPQYGAYISFNFQSDRHLSMQNMARQGKWEKKGETINHKTKTDQKTPPTRPSKNQIR
jgi:hypothetical protein